MKKLFFLLFSLVMIISGCDQILPNPDEPDNITVVLILDEASLPAGADIQRIDAKRMRRAEYTAEPRFDYYNDISTPYTFLLPPTEMNGPLYLEVTIEYRDKEGGKKWCHQEIYMQIKDWEFTVTVSMP